MSKIHTTCLAAVLMLAALLSGCGGDGAPTTPAGANVTVDAARRAAATIGPGGGSLSATSDAGVVFRLDVPAGALPVPIEIAMTPIRAIDGLPYSGGLTGAVQLEPSGLVLVRPAFLTIVTAADLTGDQRLVGFNFEGDGAAFTPTAAIDGAGGISVPVPHFSGAGAAAAVPGDPDYDYCTDPDIALRILCIAQADPGRRDKFLTAAREYLNDIVVPAVRGDTDLGLRDAVIDRYLRWLSLVDYFAAEYQAEDWLAVLEADHAAAQELIAARLREGIATLKADLCSSRRDIETLIAIFEFDWLAQATGLNALEYGLTGEQTMAGLCAEVVVENFQLPDPMPVDQDVSVDVDLRLDLGGVPVEAPFQVNLSGNLDLGEDFARCCGRTNANGEFTAVARRVIDGAISLEMNAFLLLPLFSPQGGLTLAEVPVWTTETLFRGGVSVLESFPVRVAPGAPAQLGLIVTRETASGQFSALTNAIVTFAATGGSVDPVLAVTDGEGIARTTVTAAAGADSVIVHWVVSADGVDLRRGRSATEVAATAFVDLVVWRRAVGASAQSSVYFEICAGDRFSDTSEDHGPGSIGGTAAESCNFDAETLLTGVAFASSGADPGLAPDGSSATMTFTGHTSATASVTSAVDRQLRMSVGAVASLHFSFDIVGGPMAFVITGTSVGLSSAELYNTDHSVSLSWDTSNDPPTFEQRGILPPGRYTGSVSTNLNLTTNGASQTGGTDCQMTLVLSQATTTPP